MKIYRNNTAIQYRFSLVEILVAIAIIAILLGLSGAGYTAVQRKIARTRTEATLNKLRVGLESFKSKYGYYPQQPAINPFPLYISTNIATPGDEIKNFSLFVESSKMKNEDAVLVPASNPPLYYITDGWKTNISGNGSINNGPYILYMCPGLVNTSSYDLFSPGNDRKYNWSAGTTNDSVNTDNIWPQGLKTQ